jgi:hypothetical protein
MIYDLSMTVLTLTGTLGTVWASWRLHKSFQQGKVKVIGIVTRTSVPERKTK